MRIYSYVPPTTEIQAAKKLGKDVKHIKKLKKLGILDYTGKLICNITLGEYIKGGQGYKDALSINLERKINEVIKNKARDIKWQNKIVEQLYLMYQKGYIDITYKKTLMVKPTNIYSIKKVEWNNKTFDSADKLFSSIKIKLINKIAYDYCIDYFQYLILCKMKIYLKNIQQNGVVEIMSDLIDKHLADIIEEEKKTVEFFDNLTLEKQSSILEILEVKTNIANCDLYISKDFMVKIYEKEKKENEEKLAVLQKNKHFDDCSDISDRLKIKNEINLWKLFKNKINEKNGYGYNSYGYSDFVTEFNNRTFSVNNSILSIDELSGILNETRLNFKLKKLDNDEDIIAELKNTINWDYHDFFKSRL